MGNGVMCQTRERMDQAFVAFASSLCTENLTNLTYLLIYYLLAYRHEGRQHSTSQY